MKSKTIKFSKIAIACLLSTSMFFVSGCGWLDEWLEEDSDTRIENTVAREEALSSIGYEITENTISESLLASGEIREKGVKLKGNGEDTVTILIYMNGSNLESEEGEGTTDLSEIVAAGSSDKVNILVQTMGTKTWKKYGIANDRSQIYKVDGNGLTLVKDDLGQLDCTAPGALSSFIKWGTQNYPADRYILQFWDHGGGPVYGFGYDEWNSDESATLDIDEMRTALSDAGVYFDFIGMDCCIMSCLEVCIALYDYCDYTILSEDFESGLGWYYTDWIKQLYENTSVSTVELGKTICDTLVYENQIDSEWGDDSIMAVIDQSMLKVLWTAWVDFAYANESALLGENYSRVVSEKKGGRALPRLFDFFGDYDDEDDPTLAEYAIVDIMSVASTLDTTESAALSSAISNTLVYVNASEGDKGLTGIAVTLPYGDSKSYNLLKPIFANCGIDSAYIAWLEQFVSSSNGGSDNSDPYDYDDWDDSWSGWDDYEDDYNWDDWDMFDDECGDYWDDWDDDDWGSGLWDLFFGDWDDDYYNSDDYGYYDNYYDDNCGGNYDDYYGGNYDDYYGGGYNDYYDDGYDDYYGGGFIDSFFDFFGW